MKKKIKMRLLAAFLALSCQAKKVDFEKIKLVSIDDVDIPEANKDLKYRDGDIRREFENSKDCSKLNIFFAS